MLKKLRRNDLIAAFLDLKGNPKACICTEPLWYIPYNLFIPFATVYMLELGMNDAQIGLLASIGMVLQMVSAFFGGVITDKLGRRRTTVTVDLISWTIPCLLWAFAQDFWWFLAAAALNSILHICSNSWNCLLVEDCPKSQLVNAFSLIQLCGLLAVFVAPLSALLVEEFSLVPVVRCLYLFACASMTAKFLILYRCSTETAQGRKRIEETRGVPVRKLLGGYREVLGKLLRSRSMLIALLVMVAYHVTDTTTVNFFGIYATQTLGVPESFLAIFPIIRAAIMLVFILLFQARVNRLPYRPVMLCGYGLFFLSHLLLLLAPAQNPWYLMLYTLVEACSLVCIVPRKDSLNAVFVDEQERSRVSALIFMAMVGAASPFGWIAGQLSSLDRRLPFVMNMVIFLIVGAAILFSREITRLDREHRAGAVPPAPAGNGPEGAAR